MSLVTTKQLLLDAQKGGYAIGAFNVENMEMLQLLKNFNLLLFYRQHHQLLSMQIWLISMPM